MKAVYDKKCNLIGWFNLPDGMLFGTNMNWLGFVKQENVFSVKCKWLGGFLDNTFLDRFGKPVAWIEGGIPKGRVAPLLMPLTPLKPLTPLRPLTPLTPLKPLLPMTPIGGWSKYSWKEYIEQ